MGPRCFGDGRHSSGELAKLSAGAFNFRKSRPKEMEEKIKVKGKDISKEEN